MSTDNDDGKGEGTSTRPPPQLYRIRWSDPMKILNKIKHLDSVIEASKANGPETTETTEEEIVAVGVENVEKRGALFRGILVSCEIGSVIRKSFIPCSKSDFQVYEDHIIQSVQHPSFLSSHGLVYEALGELPKSHYMVVEEVDTVAHFFGEMFESFLHKMNITRDDIRAMIPNQRRRFLEGWWDHIKVPFQTIVGDVVSGLLHMYDLKYSCGVLRMYVSRDSNGVHGKILPFMNVEKSSCYEDVKGLLKFMKNTLWLINRNLNLFPEMYVHTSYELRDFIEQINKAIEDRDREGGLMTSVLAIRAIAHPFIWDSSHRIEFMRKLRNLTQSGNVALNVFDLKLGAMMEADNFKWIVQLEADSLMMDVYLKGTEKGGAVKKYSRDVDIIRYFHALISHVNEYIKTGQIIDKSPSELMFRNAFPRVYVYLYKALMHLSQDEVSHASYSLAELQEWVLSSRPSSTVAGSSLEAV